MTPRNKLLITAAVLVVTMIGYLWWRSPSVQVPALFARIDAALRAGDADALMRQLADDYDVPKHWPMALGDGEMALLAGRERRLAQVFAAQWFRSGNRGELHWQVDAIEDTGERIVAHVTLSLVTSGPLPVNMSANLPKHRFELVRAGWLPPRLAIAAHDPIAAAP